jgi:hypothetical protein
MAVEADEAVAALDATCDDANYLTDARRSAGGQEFVLSIRPRGNVPTGPIGAEVVLVPTLKDGTRLKGRRVSFSGYIVPDLAADPTAVVVGAKALGEEIDEVVTIRSVTGRAIKSIEYVARGNRLTVEKTDELHRYRVRQLVAELGFQSNRIDFSATVDGRTCRLAVAVEYTGVSK